MKLNKNTSKTLNKYWFCISVIGHINIQILAIYIGYKKSILIAHCCGLIQWKRLRILMLIMTRGQMQTEVQTDMTSKHN